LKYLPVFPCTFLGGKKSTKRTAPRSLAFGFPRANAFFGAKMNSPAFGGAQTAFSLLPKKPFTLGCAAMGGVGSFMS